MWSLRCHIPSGSYVDDINQEKRIYSLNNGNHSPSSNMRISSQRQYLSDDDDIVEGQESDGLFDVF